MLGLNMSTIPNAPRELDYGRMSYDAPVGASGARLGATAAYGEVWPGDERHQFGIHTRADTFEVRGSVVPLETQKASLVLSATARFSDVSERDYLGAIYDDHIRTTRLAAELSAARRLGRTKLSDRRLAARLRGARSIAPGR